jgi:L,D-transpeptidase YcbB
VFSPYWNIPESIEAKETLPLIMNDPDYLQQQDIEVFRIVNDKAEVIDPSTIDWENTQSGADFQLRQRPGGDNALGLVKFIFPNRHSVYFHDTPADNLFDKLTRDFSHGCVRLEKPAELAAYVLRDQPEWTAERIDTAMHAHEEKHVRLNNPIAVHIVYLTARVDEDGEAQFFEDIYGYDLKQIERLRTFSDGR